KRPGGFTATTKQVTTNSCVVRLIVPNRPAKAPAKRVAQTCEGPITAHDEVGAVSRKCAVARRRGNRCRKEGRFPDGGSKRKPAHEGCAKIGTCPKRFKRLRRGVIDILQRNA